MTTSKPKNERNNAYLDYVRRRPCCVSRSTVGVVAHHVRMFGTGGVGLKPSDYLVVPLRSDLHQFLHSTGERSFWRRNDVDPATVVHDTLAAYCADEFGVALNLPNVSAAERTAVYQELIERVRGAKK